MFGQNHKFVTKRNQLHFKAMYCNSNPVVQTAASCAMMCNARLCTTATGRRRRRRAPRCPTAPSASSSPRKRRATLCTSSALGVATLAPNLALVCISVEIGGCND